MTIRFSLGVVVGVLVWGALRYLFSGKETRGHGEETKGQDRVSGKRLDELNGEKCPHCGKLMEKVADPKQSHIWYETCAEHGIFMDAGEFTDYKYETLVDKFRDLITGNRS